MNAAAEVGTAEMNAVTDGAYSVLWISLTLLYISIFYVFHDVVLHSIIS